MRAFQLPVILAITLTMACTDGTPPATAPSEPALLTAAASANPLADRYVVVFNERVARPGDETEELRRAHGLTVHHRYETVLKGFAATLPPQALDGLRRNPNVEYIVPDAMASVSENAATPRSWGLDRADQRLLPLNNLYGWTSDGRGVEVYILDTGIRYTHTEYAGRALSGPDFVSNDDLSEDCHGHGTHVAGTVGGTTTGIAKNARLIGVRVLGCGGMGPWSGVIAGVEWVTQQKLARPNVPMVVNMSLGGAWYAPLNTAIDNSVLAGVVHVVAAGNENTDACSRSPASTPSAITVAATTSADARASFSNWGWCVDLFAPGVGITSSTFLGDATYASWNGTSMAAPHVAGVAALYLSAHPTANPEDVWAAIRSGATPDRVADQMGSPNLLLYSLIAGNSILPIPDPIAPPTPPPPSLTKVHVGPLVGIVDPIGKKNWRASVIIEVHESAHIPVTGATVLGTWSGAASGSASCMTDGAGRCTVSTGNLRTSGSATFKIVSVSGTGLEYTGTGDTGTIKTLSP